MGVRLTKLRADLDPFLGRNVAMDHEGSAEVSGNPLDDLAVPSENHDLLATLDEVFDPFERSLHLALGRQLFERRDPDEGPCLTRFPLSLRVEPSSGEDLVFLGEVFDGLQEVFILDGPVGQPSPCVVLGRPVVFPIGDINDDIVVDLRRKVREYVFLETPDVAVLSERPVWSPW